jgi:hypothetical protein
MTMEGTMLFKGERRVSVQIRTQDDLDTRAMRLGRTVSEALLFKPLFRQSFVRCRPMHDHVNCLGYGLCLYSSVAGLSLRLPGQDALRMS